MVDSDGLRSSREDGSLISDLSREEGSDLSRKDESSIADRVKLLNEPCDLCLGEELELVKNVDKENAELSRVSSNNGVGISTASVEKDEKGVPGGDWVSPFAVACTRYSKIRRAAPVKNFTPYSCLGRTAAAS